MILEPIQYLLGALSGVLVGFTLGLVGGGGSILAVPLMVYLVRVPNAHLAIGTSAFAVAANAATGLIGHAKAHTVKWRCGGMYATSGIVGALLGSTAGKAVDGGKLLFLFALVMVVVGVMMLRGRKNVGNPGAECNREKAPKVLGYGLGTGLFSGFFGIGGGFLIVPGLIGSTGMPILNAVGTSLIAVTAFGLTTAAIGRCQPTLRVDGATELAAPYEERLVQQAALFEISDEGGGGLIGTRIARRLGTGGTLTTVFAALIFVVAAYMLWKSVGAFT